MIGTLILSHGGLARELLTAARKIAGDLAQFEALSLEWTDSAEVAAAKVESALARLDTGQGVLVLADTFGGTPCNIALQFQVGEHVEVISGVNLPMVMRLACNGNRQALSLAETARWIQEKGRSSICIGSEMVDVCEGKVRRKVVAGVGSGG